MISWFDKTSYPILFMLGVMIIAALLVRQLAKTLGLPKIVAYMVTGIIIGPSVLNFLDDKILNNMEFITHLVLGFVAFKIGLEVNLQKLKTQGCGIIITTVFESFLAVLTVAVFLYVLTGNLALSILFGALAPASAPAGTIAVIDETGSKGALTQTLYSIVGIDDGLGIIIFGLLLPVATFSLSHSGNGLVLNEDFWISVIEPFREILYSILFGGAVAVIFIGLTYFKNFQEELLPLTFGAVVIVCGISQFTNFSEILSNMIFGLLVGNFPKNEKLGQYEEQDIGFILPLFYLLFFIIAGANLHIESLSGLGLIGLFYVVGRTVGLGGGAFIGASLGGLEKKVRKYLGFGILSQAGVAIGLALIVKNEMHGLGPQINEAGKTMGDYIGNVIFTTITATSVFFEIFGPIATKFALKKAGEIKKDR